MNSISPNLNIMIKACEKASKVIIRDFGEIENLQVSKKGPRDFVTKTDKKVEKILIDELSKAKKNYSFITEESGIIKNTKLNERFRSSETVEKASLEEIKFNYLYDDETDYFFMNPENFEQINIRKEIVGDKGKMLTENLEVTINFHDETPLSVNLPNQIKSKIETTDAALKGQTVSSSYKPATLDNGLSIQVPPFIESGDEIIVDTRTLEYVKKV